MDSFFPSEYFDLTAFEHASLFSDEEPVWFPIKKLGKYLLSLPLGNILGIVERGAFLINPKEISIGRGSIVEPGAYIQGPCIIGEDCQVRHGAYIRGNVITGNRCIIGHATEVKNSIFFRWSSGGTFCLCGRFDFGQSSESWRWN